VNNSEYIVLAGGCFWGLEDLLGKLNGVVDTEAGYAGGDFDDPTYHDVKTGSTGHAESVKVFYDKEVISLKEIFLYFFKIHDPTTVNRQGNDKGSQYRSTIFIRNDEEKLIVESVIDEINELGRFSDQIQTTLENDNNYYKAEEFHQKYLQKNPGGYSCHFERD
jgi:peptide-methionine (S)-S-oxide reductase